MKPCQMDLQFWSARNAPAWARTMLKHPPNPAAALHDTNGYSLSAQTLTTDGCAEWRSNMDKATATNLAHKYHIPLDKDFHALDSATVERVLEAADQHKYRKPRNANGSRGRYFFCALVRASRRQAQK